MSLRTKLLPVLDLTDQILGPAVLDFRPTQIVMNVATWSGGRRGAGVAAIAPSPLPAWTKIRHVTTREVAESGGRYESGDLIVGPIRPTFTRANNTVGGFSEQYLDPEGIQEGTDVYFTVTQTEKTGTGINGDYALREFRRDRALRFMLVLKRKRTTPGDSAWDPSVPAGLQLWWQDDSLVFNGTTVTGWTDKSANGRNGTASGSLTYNAADANFNGLPSMLGAGGNMASTAFNLPCPYDVVIVSAGLQSGGFYFWSRQLANDLLNGANAGSYACFRGASSTIVNTQSATWGEFGTSPKTVELSTDGTGAGTKLYMNGTSQTLTNVGGNAGTAANTAPFILLDGGSPTAVAFVAVYSRLLTGNERLAMNLYLRNRYAHY